MFALNSDITIGSFHFSGVNEINIKRSLHSYVDTATIKLPSICKIIRKGKSGADTLTIGEQFNDGDPVIINLGYNGSMNEEFRGFVKRRNLDMPLEIACEGYSWQLRRNTIKGSWESISVKELLQIACANTDITIDVLYNPVLTNVQADNCTGAQLIDLIKKSTDANLTIFFISPQKLWCGLVYDPYSHGTDVFGLGQVNYKPGYNVIKHNDLQERNLNDDPLVVNYIKKTSTGQVLSESSDPLIPELRKYTKLLNRLSSSDDLKAIAAEKQNRENYIGYEGRIQAFLQPYALPAFNALITDDRYKEKNGVYLVESTEVIYGTRGARRIVEIGPKQGFANSTS